jgi:predicted phage terminase large subunit-like protein
MDSEALKAIQANPESVVRFIARQRFITFARYMMPKMEITNFHKVYYEVLDRFAHKQIKKLIVSVPPQHGKSQGSSRFLPAFLLGLNPDLKIVIGSYSTDQAKTFNRDVQRIVNSEAYKAVFPDTFFNNGKVRMDNVYQCNSEISEPVGHSGFVRAVGRNGSLTGKSVDISILDDVYKDFNEANSKLIREQAWMWYVNVVRTRLHNNSQEIIVFTRWHEDDLIGRLENSGEKIVPLKSMSDLDNIPDGAWVLVNFEAIKTSAPSEIDPREVGQALWPERHSLERLESQRALDPVGFDCLYQGSPETAEGRLYQPFKEYSDKSEWGTYVRSGCYVDVADEGDDFLSAISYDIYKSSEQFFNEKKQRFEPLLFALVTDIEYTDAPTDVTTVTVPRLINANRVQKAWIESNNGGSQFEKVVKKKVRALTTLFYQGANKESRIVTNAPFVNQHIIFPVGWSDRYPKAYKAITEFLRVFTANKHDDAPDCLTGIYEKEIADGNTKPYGSSHRGIKVR